MSSGVQNLLDSVLNDGARPSKFEVYFSFKDPNTGISSTDIVFLGKTTSFPSKSHSPVDFKYKGRKIPIKGQVKYNQVWDCTFYLTEDHKLKYVFDNWMESLDNIHYGSINSKGLRDAIVANHAGYTTDITIIQKDFDGVNNMAQYVIHNAFPTSISASPVSYESTSAVLDFTVSFSYSHYTMSVMAAAQGNFIDEMVGKLESMAQNAVNGVMNQSKNGVNNMLGSAMQSVSSSVPGLSSLTPTSSRQQSKYGANTEGDVTAPIQPSSGANAGNMLSKTGLLSGFGK